MLYRLDVEVDRAPQLYLLSSGGGLIYSLAKVFLRSGE
jgi:hypothetical protein